MDKRGLLEHLTEAGAELLTAVEGLSETEMTTLPVAGVWTTRDILVHISGWAAWDLAGIRSIKRLERAAREVFHCRPEEIRCEGCHGPLDSCWSPECRFRTCTEERDVTFCYECADLPCDDLSAFSADRSDIPLANLHRLAEVGFETWLAEKEARWRCPACGKPVDIYSLFFAPLEIVTVIVQIIA
ncbi:MAG: DUF3795 domain-containing protein, partial [Anaerolineae bacterium]